MSQPDFFNDEVTILRIPSWLGRDVHKEHELPLTVGDYKVTPGDRWTVTSLKTKEVVYNGIGPVEVVRLCGCAVARLRGCAVARKSMKR